MSTFPGTTEEMTVSQTPEGDEKVSLVCRADLEGGKLSHTG
jgi:hypothetical protein